jgi:hypothetical protein
MINEVLIGFGILAVLAVIDLCIALPFILVLR